MKSRNICRHTEIKKYSRNNPRVKRKFRKQIELNENKNKICIEEIIKKDNSHSVMSNSLQPHELYIAYQAPLSMEFSSQEYWSVLLFTSPKDLPDPGIEPGSLALQVDSLPSEPQGSPKIHKARLK